MRDPSAHTRKPVSLPKFIPLFVRSIMASIMKTSRDVNWWGFSGGGGEGTRVEQAKKVTRWRMRNKMARRSRRVNRMRLC